MWFSAGWITGYAPRWTGECAASDCFFDNAPLDESQRDGSFVAVVNDGSDSADLSFPSGDCLARFGSVGRVTVDLELDQEPGWAAEVLYPRYRLLPAIAPFVQVNIGGRGPIVDCGPLGRCVGGGPDKGFYFVGHGAAVEVGVNVRYDRFDAFCLVGHESGGVRTRVDEHCERADERGSGHQDMDRVFRADERIGERQCPGRKHIGWGSGRRARSIMIL